MWTWLFCCKRRMQRRKDGRLTLNSFPLLSRLKRFWRQLGNTWRKDTVLKMRESSSWKLKGKLATGLLLNSSFIQVLVGWGRVLARTLLRTDDKRRLNRVCTHTRVCGLTQNDKEPNYKNRWRNCQENGEISRSQLEWSCSKSYQEIHYWQRSHKEVWYNSQIPRNERHISSENWGWVNNERVQWFS